MKSSSSSLRRQRLGEITEHVEESDGPSRQAGKSRPTTGQAREKDMLMESANHSDGPALPSSEAVVSAVRSIPQAPASSTSSDEPILNGLTHPPPEPNKTKISAVSSAEKSLPEPPEASSPYPRQDLPVSQSSQKAVDANTGEQTDPEPEAQESIPLPRPSLAETERGSVYSYTAPYLQTKPKEKRRPRPHIEPSGRPKTSASANTSGPSKPVANLPASIQVSNRTASNLTYRPDSQQSSKSVPARIGSVRDSEGPPPLPQPGNFHIASLYKAPQTSPAPLKPPPTLALSSNATPEKLRLMKALQLRKKNIQMAQRASALMQPPSERATTRDSTSPGPARDQGGRDSAHGAANSRLQAPNAKDQLETDQKDTPVSSTASPISPSNLSEKPSSRSSFTENERPSTGSSISSDTASSVTPKAVLEENHPNQPSDPVSKVEKADKKKAIENTKDDKKTKGLNSQRAKNKGHSSDQNAESVPDQIKQSSISPQQQHQAGGPGRPDLAHQKPSNSSMTRRDRKRRGILDPLQVVASPDASEFSEDESLMEELRNARVEEAKPVSVARSPATPIFSRGSNDRLKDLSRMNSMTSHKASDSVTTSPDRPRTGSTRSMSSSLPQWPPVKEEIPPLPLAKKGPLSSGISKRIKALEVFTNRDSSVSPSSPKQNSTSRGLLGFGSIRKRTSFLPNNQPPNMSTSTPPPKELPPMTPPDVEVTEAETPQARPWVRRQGSMTEINTPSQKGESISVTARIIRTEDNNYFPAFTDPTEPIHMNLFKSPLIVEHERPEAATARPLMTRDLSFQSMDSSATRERARFSFTSHRSNSQTRLHTSDSMASRLSTTSSHKKSANTFPRSTSDNSSVHEEKKDSRSSRLKKRMSILSMGSRRSLVSALAPKHQKGTQSVATIVEHNEAPSLGASESESLPHVVDVGDVNVQFPDTLLWKRRYLRIDDQGYVIFSPPQMEKNSQRQITRKFHLTDFKKPTLPDIERQEMAWSIRMELDDGSCVQCACENKQAQAQVLKGRPQD